MAPSGEGREPPGTEPTAPDTRAPGTPRGTGEIRDEVLDTAPGLASPEPNRHGRARAMTVFSPVKAPWSRPPGGVLWLYLMFLAGRVSPNATIRQLSFIHFARWVIIR